MSKDRSRGWRRSRGQRVAVVAAIALPAVAALLVSGAGQAYGGDDCCGGGGASGGGDAPVKKVDAKTDPATASSGVVVDLGNAKCPVMGGKPDGRTWSEWSGVRVGHCCPGCTKKFASDPEKYLAASGGAWKAAVAAVKKVDEASPSERAKALAELKKKWTVVREPAAPAPPSTLVDLGNASCPVMGGEPDGKTWSEWNGLRVGHCCPGCSKKFAAKPEEFLEGAGIEWKAAAAAVKAVDAAKGEDRAKALAALKARWTVLRAPAAELSEPEEPKEKEPKEPREDAK